MKRHRRARFIGALILAGAALAGGCASTHGTHSSDPGFVARNKLAHELASRGDWVRAFAMLDELHREQPQDPEILTLRGIVYRERGLFADAETDLKEAIKLTPESADAHAALGILYDVQMRPEAEAQHREAVRLGPENAVYLNNLGFSLFLRQRFKEAVSVYESAARLAPMSRRVRTNLGFACAALGDLRRAAREFQMGGSEAEAKNNLGFAYERRGDMTNAYQLYVEALRLDPKAERARSNLIHAALILGRELPPEASAPATPSGAAPALDPALKSAPSDAPKLEAHP